VFFLFDSSDFVEAALVAASGEWRVEESLDHFEGGGGCEDAGTEGQDVRVVVLASELGGDDVVGQGGADAGDFVGGDGNPNARASHDDSQIILLRGNALAHRLAEVGIVHRVFRASAWSSTA
jgi:hypothetical protein